MLSDQIKTYIPKLQQYFKDQPILKAWLFGSCSRGEETPESDVDILVTYDDTVPVSLLTICRLRVQLSELLSREIDLVEDGTLMPFAVESAQHDKILIYERPSTR